MPQEQSCSLSLSVSLSVSELHRGFLSPSIQVEPAAEIVCSDGVSCLVPNKLVVNSILLKLRPGGLRKVETNLEIQYGNGLDQAMLVLFIKELEAAFAGALVPAVVRQVYHHRRCPSQNAHYSPLASRSRLVFSKPATIKFDYGCTF